MDVPIFLAADYAKTCEGGKLDVMGIFNVLNSKSYPARHRLLFLVIRLELEHGEFGHEHDINVVFIDADGRELGDVEGKITVPKPDNQMTIYADTIMQIHNLIIERPGNYEFKLAVNHHTIAALPIKAVQTSEPIEDDKKG